MYICLIGHFVRSVWPGRDPTSRSALSQWPGLIPCLLLLAWPVPFSTIKIIHTADKDHAIDKNTYIYFKYVFSTHISILDTSLVRENTRMNGGEEKMISYAIVILDNGVMIMSLAQANLGYVSTGPWLRIETFLGQRRCLIDRSSYCIAMDNSDLERQV